MTASGEKSRLNGRDWTREIVITSAEGHCDFGRGRIILCESDRNGEEEADNDPSCNYTMEFVL